MSGRGYTIFDTSIGRCGIAWGHAGILGVQLPEAREIETRKRLFDLYPDAREMRAPLNVEFTIEGITALLRGETVTYVGKIFSVDRVKLDYAPRYDIAIFMAGRGDASLKLAGEVADGLLLSNMCAPGFVARAVAAMREAAQ